MDEDAAADREPGGASEEPSVTVDEQLLEGARAAEKQGCLALFLALDRGLRRWPFVLS